MWLCLQQCDGDYYQVNVLMSTTQFQYLKDYVDQKQNSTAEVHSILSSMMRDFRSAAVYYVSVFSALTLGWATGRALSL